MTERPRKPPEQASLDSQLDPEAEPSGIDSVPLLQESHVFPEDLEPEEPREEAQPAIAPEEPSSSTKVPELVETDDPASSEVTEVAAEVVAGGAALEGPKRARHASESVEQLAFDDPGFDEVEPEVHPELEPELDHEVDAESGPWEADEGSGPEFEESEPLPGRFPQQWIVAGLADLAVNLAVVALGAIAVWQLGIPVRWSGWPGYLGFAFSFSFLYTSMPLAFWGQTPGMAISGLRAADGERQLSFGQTALRWAAAALTLGSLGLPWLLAGSGRPLADRLSRSQTLVWHEPED